MTTTVQPGLLSQPLTQGTAVATTSGTSVDFTGIPSWAKRITVMFNGVSTSGSANPIVQLGSGTPQTTGYSSSAGAQSSTAGFVIFGTTNTDVRVGVMTIVNVSGNIWVESGAAHSGAGQGTAHCGLVTLSGVLDRIRLTTTNGTDTFDAGSVNILYEG